MELIGILVSDNTICDRIRAVFDKELKNNFILHFFSNTDAILEFLNFDLPELIILDFTDCLIDIDSILSHIREDSWLHRFGIIGIFDKRITLEKELLRKLIDINIINLFDYSIIEKNLEKTIRIVLQNRQIIFHRDISDKLLEDFSGSFIIDNDPDSVACYSNLIVTILFNKGYIDEQMKFSLQVVIIELIMNGIEHGNCGLTHKDKSELLRTGQDVSKIIYEKHKDRAIANKRVYLDYEITQYRTNITIRDEGEGFDWRVVLKSIENQDVLSPHGRGIFMSKLLVKELSFNEKGNEVRFFIDHIKDSKPGIPAAFKEQEIIDLKPGEVIFYEGEESDFIYYISKGNINIFHANNLVGKLTPKDVFVGDMSFLLHERRCATVNAETDVKLIRISKKGFVSVIKNYPHYGILLSKLFANRLVNLNKKAAHIH
ncbi:MAG: cyclic nucleotide-binding domain-containing protein [Thermodesulfobacteriota bacterium]|nr:cyclic nucleotide-binding domain-containing protein [Thermodesulfobacteriota bacterium]